MSSKTLSRLSSNRTYLLACVKQSIRLCRQQVVLRVLSLSRLSAHAPGWLYKLQWHPELLSMPEYMSRLRLRMAPTVVCWCCIMWDMDICVTWSIPSLGDKARSEPVAACASVDHSPFGLHILAKMCTSEGTLHGSKVVLVNL